jgi:large subunit ribosomal protein L30
MVVASGRSSRPGKASSEAGPFVVVRQVRSSIGQKPKARRTLRALGLGRIGKARVLPDRPEIRGMIAVVSHLVEVEEVNR